MKTVNHLIGILNIVLGAGALAAALAFLLRLKKTVKGMEPLSGSMDAMNAQLSAVSRKTGKIRASADSFKFFASLYIIFVVVKETLKSWRNERSLPGSFAGAYMRHSKQIRKIRI